MITKIYFYSGRGYLVLNPTILYQGKNFVALATKFTFAENLSEDPQHRY